MTPFRLALVALLLALPLAACGDRPPQTPSLHDALPDLPLPPEPTLVSRSGSADALQLVVTSPADAKMIAQFYREYFKTGGWKLVGDSRTADGSVALYAERGGPPMWVLISRPADAPVTTVSIIGAVVKPAPPPPAPAR